MSRPRTRHLSDVEDQSPDHTGSMSSSRFLTDAPVAGEAPALELAGEASYGPDRPIRLLVIDDDLRVRAAFVQTIALEPDMVMVDDAADARTALALAERTDPSVAVVDVLLPDEETGLALVTSLNLRPGCAVVAMSVHGGLRAAALAAGAVAFVEKESDIDAILNTVRAAALTHSV
jgi:DNA-binding NtrC family response regulator